MSRVVFIPILLVLFTSTGCLVMDELDAANAEMAKMSTGKKVKEKAEEDSSATLASKALKTKNELLDQSKRWWKEATSLSPTATDSSIVNCRLQGETQFMSNDDCLVRGGVPQGVSR